MGIWDDADGNTVTAYSRPVSTVDGTGSSSTVYSSRADEILNKNTEIHPDCSPKQRQVKTDVTCPIVVAVDVTGSMGTWPKVIWDKLPMFFGQILMQGYLEDPAISFCAIGDNTSDRFPLQVTDFASGTDIDEQISKIYLEGGGGGNQKESYEFAAYYYLKHSKIPNAERNKSFFFITGDEGFFDTIDGEHIGKWITGETVPAVSAKQVFKELRKKYHVFLLHKEYHDRSVEPRIYEQWASIIGEERILKLSNPKAVVDAMLGAIATVSGTRSLDKYVEDMKARGQDDDRIAEVSKALGGLSI